MSQPGTMNEAEDSVGRSKTMHILQQLEQGQIDVEQAERLLTDVDEPQQAHETPQAFEMPARWRTWWLIPFSIGLGLAVCGVGVATLGGWWWLCAVPLLTAGVLLVTISAATNRSPWVHVRVYNERGGGPRKVAISLPIPVRFTAWVLRHFGPYIKPLERTGLDELLLALDMLKEGVSREGPLFIEVDDDEDGERIEVYLG